MKFTTRIMLFLSAVAVAVAITVPTAQAASSGKVCYDNGKVTVCKGDCNLACGIGLALGAIAKAIFGGP